MILYCHIGNRGLFHWSGLQTLQKSNDGFYHIYRILIIIIQILWYKSIVIISKFAHQSKSSRNWYFMLDGCKARISGLSSSCVDIFLPNLKKRWESDEKESGRVYIVSARKVKPWSTFCTLPPILHSREIISKNLLFQMFCSLIPLILFLCTRY